MMLRLIVHKKPTVNLNNVKHKWSEVGGKPKLKGMNVFKYDKYKIARCESGDIFLCEKDGCYSSIKDGACLCKFHASGKDSYRYCRTTEVCCTTKAVFGYEKNKPISCKTHKKDDMTDVLNVKCLYPNCKKQGIFGYQDLKGTYCSDHKKDDMMDLRHTICIVENCQKRPRYGYESPPLYCFDHSTDDMIDLEHTLCKYDGCMIRPNFGYIDKQPIYCVSHKLNGMNNVVSKICEFVGCDKQPTFSYEGTKERFCLTHKLLGMIDVKNKRCEFEDCMVQPRCGYEGESRRFCSKHKLEGMIDLFAERCYFDDCNKWASFGFIGEGKISCFSHKIEGMIDLSHYLCQEVGCDSYASYGILYSCKKIHCRTHVKLNEYSKSKLKPICTVVNCNKTAYFVDINNPDIYPVRCENHKIDTDIKLVQRHCPNCNEEVAFPSDKNICMNCGKYRTILDSSFRVRFKENVIKDFLSSNNVAFVYDKQIPLSKNKHRPDFLINSNFGKIILEVDEHQHKKGHNYSQESEINRMKTICDDLLTIKSDQEILFIRYNPDKYTGIQYDTKERMNYLYLVLTTFINRGKLGIKTGVTYLYYDGFDNTPHILNIY
jgi:hypothetical protein